MTLPLLSHENDKTQICGVFAFPTNIKVNFVVSVSLSFETQWLDDTVRALDVSH